MIIVDTSFLISLFYKNDSNHSIATEKFLEIRNEKKIFLVSNLVIEELITVTKLRLKSVLQQIETLVTEIVSNNSNVFKFYFVKENEFKQVLSLAFETEFTKLSFTDISLLLISTKIKNSEIITFDKDLKKITKAKFLENQTSNKL